MFNIFKRKTEDDCYCEYPHVEVGVIDVRVGLDSLEPIEKTRNYKGNAVILLDNEMFAREIKEYIADQMKELALETEGDLALLIRGKIFGASELYSLMKQYKLEYEEGELEDNSTMD